MSGLCYKDFAKQSWPAVVEVVKKRKGETRTLETSGLEQQVAEPEFAVWVGIDWADQKHFWSLQEVGSERLERGELQHSPEAVEAWVAELRLRFGHRPIAVA